MKKVSIAIAVLSALAAAPAMAAQVQMYGILDTGINIQKIGKVIPPTQWNLDKEVVHVWVLKVLKKSVRI